MHVKAPGPAAAHAGAMPYLVLLARALFAAIFLAAAPGHFTEEAIHHATELGVPFARLAVPVSGLLAIAGGLSVLTGYKARLGAALLIGFLVPVTFGMHAFWRLSDPSAIFVQRAMFMKNLSMLGAALFIACVGAGPAALDSWLRSRR